MSAHAIATRSDGGALRLAGEVKGGIASALVGLAIALTLGLLAFGALGAEYADLGVRAAFSTIVFAAPVALLLGGTTIPGAGPRVSSTLILAALIASSASDSSLTASGTSRVDAVVFLAATSLALSGLIQVGFGLARLGTLARFVPYPVVGGFMNGVAILIVLWQIPYLIGLPAPVKGQALLDAIPGTQPWTLVVGVATAALVWTIAMRWKAAPAALLALLGGTALYYGIAAMLPSAELGPRLGEISGTLSPPVALARLGTRSGIDLLASHWTTVVGTAAAIAVIGSLDSLLAAAAVDAVVVATPHHAHPEHALAALGQGLHVLVEKPLAVHKREAERVIRAARPGGRSCDRSNPGSVSRPKMVSPTSEGLPWLRTRATRIEPSLARRSSMACRRRRVTRSTRCATRSTRQKIALRSSPTRTDTAGNST